MHLICIDWGGGGASEGTPAASTNGHILVNNTSSWYYFIQTAGRPNIGYQRTMTTVACSRPTTTEFSFMFYLYIKNRQRAECAETYTNNYVLLYIMDY